MRRVVNTPGAYRSTSPLVQAIVVRGLVFVSGMPPVDRGGRTVGEDITTQTHRVMRNPATIKAIWKVAQTEGVFLDPVYTRTGMAELLRWADAHRGDSPLVFLHTGGVTALFAYVRELVGETGSMNTPGRRISRLGAGDVRRRQVART